MGHCLRSEQWVRVVATLSGSTRPPRERSNFHSHFRCRKYAVLNAHLKSRGTRSRPSLARFRAVLQFECGQVWASYRRNGNRRNARNEFCSRFPARFPVSAERQINRRRETPVKNAPRDKTIAFSSRSLREIPNLSGRSYLPVVSAPAFSFFNAPDLWYT